VPEGRAGACSCVVADVAAHVQAATTVFVGNVASIDESGVATFSVTKTYKGAAPRRLEVSSGGPDDPCGVPLVDDRTYVVFAHPVNGSLTTDLCSGTTDDLSIAGLLSSTVATMSPSPRAAPPPDAVSSRALPIAAAGTLIAFVAGAALLAVRALSRPRPIA